GSCSGYRGRFGSWSRGDAGRPRGGPGETARKVTRRRMTSPMGGQAGAWATMRSFQHDRSISRQKLRPGTTRRIVAFARPYRRLLVGFLLVVVFEAGLGTVLPLIFKAIIDDGIIPGRVGVVEVLAGVVALIALVDAVTSLLQRWLSVRIGE